jgi:hypothetical protein
MELKNSNYLLRKIVLLSHYFCLFSLKYNKVTQEFETYKTHHIFNFVVGPLLILINALLTYYGYFIRTPSFIINVGIFLFVALHFMLILMVIIWNKKYEKLTVIIINKLNKLQFTLANFTFGRMFKEYILIFILIIDSCYHFFLMTHSLIFNTNVIFSIEALISIIVYGNHILLSVLRNLTEGTFLFMFIIISKYLDNLAESCVKNSEMTHYTKIMRRQHELYEISKSLTINFSLIIFFLIAFYFINTLVFLLVIFFFIVHRLEFAIYYMGCTWLISLYKLVMIIKTIGDCVYKVAL